MKIIDIERFQYLEFDEKTNNLSFVIENYHRQPKITRYVTSNYVKTPIYGDYSVRTKIIKKFNKKINPYKFVNEQIKDLNLSKEFLIEIINEIGIIPPWRQKEIDLENKLKEIEKVKKSYRNFNHEKKSYQFKETDFIEKPSNFWLCFLLLIFTFGFSFKGFVSKKQAFINIENNKKNKIWNNEHKISIDAQNTKLKFKIENHNLAMNKILDDLKKQYYLIENKEIEKFKIDEKGWIELRNATNFSHHSLKEQKGVYIIWNKTKNKHYVGQSKNIGIRLFNQHFKDGNVKDILFAKDWYESDEFYFKYFICKTKDELDSLQKRYIEEYNAFGQGYNSTGGKN